MKTFISIAGLIALSGGCPAGEYSLEIRVVPILAPDKQVRIVCDGTSISVRDGSAKPVSASLEAGDAGRISKVIRAAPKEKWQKFWGSIEFLDGYRIAVSLKIEGKEYAFSGANGCPPGFADVVKLIGEISRVKMLIGAHWDAMEKSATQHEDFEAFLYETLRKAKEEAKRDLGD